MAGYVAIQGANLCQAVHRPKHFLASRLCQVQKEIFKVVVGLLAKSLDVHPAAEAQNLGTWTNRL